MDLHASHAMLSLLWVLKAKDKDKTYRKMILNAKVWSIHGLLTPYVKALH